jgi:hypothetical protein
MGKVVSAGLLAEDALPPQFVDRADYNVDL